MEIILKEDVKGLGYKDDLVTVKPGYARNFLIPQGFAVIATLPNKKMLAENLKQAAHKKAKFKQNAEELAAQIGELEIVVEAKAGESGRIFGAVTPLQIAEGLSNKGFDIERKKITISTDIKELGDYTATLDLHKEVKHDIAIKVVSAD